MKRLLVVLLVLGSMVMGGCASVTQTPQERDRRILQLSNLQMKMLVEDWDYLWLVDHNTRTTPWHSRIGL